MSGWLYLSEPLQAFNSTEIKTISSLADRSHLWLSELSEAGCQAIVINVAVSLYSHIQDVDRLILDALDDIANRCLHSKIHIQVYDQPVRRGGLFLSPCCPLHHTEQDCLPLERLDLGEESRRSSSTRLLCSWRGGKIIHAINHACYISPPIEGTYPG